MKSAAYRIVHGRDGWGVEHDGKVEGAYDTGRPWGFALDDVLIEHYADEDRVREVLDLIGRGDEFERPAPLGNRRLREAQSGA
jgi:hypothetical protein